MYTPVEAREHHNIHAFCDGFLQGQDGEAQHMETRQLWIIHWEKSSPTGTSYFNSCYFILGRIKNKSSSTQSQQVTGRYKRHFSGMNPCKPKQASSYYELLTGWQWQKARRLIYKLTPCCFPTQSAHIWFVLSYLRFMATILWVINYPGCISGEAELRVSWTHFSYGHWLHLKEAIVIWKEILPKSIRTSKLVLTVSAHFLTSGRKKNGSKWAIGVIS